MICPCAGQALLLPLTSSVYVAGTLASADTVLVDIGTGYYIEVSTSVQPVHTCIRSDMLALYIFVVAWSMAWLPRSIKARHSSC